MRRTIATALVALSTALAVLPADISSAEGSKPTPGVAAGDSVAARQADRSLARAQQILAGGRGGQARPDATLALVDLYQALPNLDADERRQAEGVLGRPTQGASDPYGDGYTVPATKKCKKHFCLHYVTSTTDAPPSMEWVNTSLRTMNKVWKHEVGKLNYRKPLTDAGKGGSRKFDVYLKDVGAKNLYGYCAPEAKPKYRKYTASGFCVLDNDFNPAQFGGQAAKASLRVTAAHEFFHAIQFGYDYADDRWFLEATATWMEERFADKINDNRQYLPYGQMAVPTSSLDRFRSPCCNQYANWTFFEYLSSRYGNGVVRAAWQKAAAYKGAPDKYSIKAIAAVLGKRGGLPRVFARYAAYNVHPGRHYAEGGAWPSAEVAQSFKLQKSLRRGASTVKIDHLASRNFVAKPGKTLHSKKWKLRIKVAGPSRKTSPQVFVLVTRKHGSAIMKTVKLSRAGNGKVKVPFSHRKVRGVTVTIANVSTRYKCFPDNPKPFACSGKPKDQHKTFALHVKAVKG
ncbi:hypothetical protein H5V45_17600 [Nocardioides sp. KIGAM211]|uniref:Uncharacterized protein n=1 Tax=Nocardioides luti TaxID=2761101 RepID=A0A7X0RIW2_9ACTN|nr:MXAN_6640 family putative metalloprotease [Nocardioides luti]MBB6629146.1 hypothetical protein [Nocardioides luti]